MFFFQPFRPATTVFENVEFPLDVKDSITFLLVLLSFPYTACPVYTMFRVRTQASREFVWRPALGADHPEWHGMSKEMGQYFIKFLSSNGLEVHL